MKLQFPTRQKERKQDRVDLGQKETKKRESTLKDLSSLPLCLCDDDDNDDDHGM